MLKEEQFHCRGMFREDAEVHPVGIYGRSERNAAAAPNDIAHDKSPSAVSPSLTRNRCGRHAHWGFPRTFTHRERACTGVTFQIFWQYSRMDRSEENQPILAVFRIDILVQR